MRSLTIFLQKRIIQIKIWSGSKRSLRRNSTSLRRSSQLLSKSRMLLTQLIRLSTRQRRTLKLQIKLLLLFSHRTSSLTRARTISKSHWIVSTFSKLPISAESTMNMVSRARGNKKVKRKGPPLTTRGANGEPIMLLN